jgi:hypothetical protein
MQLTEHNHYRPLSYSHEVEAPGIYMTHSHVPERAWRQYYWSLTEATAAANVIEPVWRMGSDQEWHLVPM